jgi:outer membrane lipoprotein-sorting protein
MKLKYSGGTVLAFFLAASAAPAVPNSVLQDLLARMDQAARQFQSMSATLNYTVHTQVIDDDTKESGTVVMKKMGPNQVQAKMDFAPPNQRSALFEGRKVQVYMPAINTLNVYELGDKGDQVDRFVMLGFGTSGTELAHDYEVKILGSETVLGQRTTKLELLPKLPEVQKLVGKIELWIPEGPAAPYPVQEKIYEKTPGDYRITAYSDFKLNPNLSSDALKLKMKPRYITEYPQK